MEHGNSNNIFYPLQHGFREYRSCETQSLEFIDDVSHNMQLGKQTDILIMDFSKAFDSHQRLLYKLHQYGIQSNSLNWIKSFLYQVQSVVVKGSTSDPVHVTSGVPQGSDLPENLNSTVHIFADDILLPT